MNLSYNISDKLKVYLAKIDKLRTEILITPLSPKNELRLKWDANLDRVAWSLALIDNPLSRANVVRLMSAPTSKRKMNDYEKDAVNQKKAFDYIKDNWTVTKSPVTLATVKKLYDLSCKDTVGPITGLTEYSERRIDTLFDYLQKGQDHPVIQAGVVQAEIVAITPFDSGNTRVARLLSYLYLYKNGYNVRNMVVMEEYFKRDLVAYKSALEMSKIQGNLTLWLEYFTLGLSESLEKSLDNVSNLKFKEEIHANYWKLNTRQELIMSNLENPDKKITNKELQKLFKISQITASRDLSKLVSLGLLLTNGKGRSVYYTAT